MKVIIQIPCLNERETLPQTLADLPRQIDGIDEIEVLIIDDGSTDGTAERAKELGVHHIVRFPENRGLAAAFMAGIDAGLRLGADVIVNTDADNQYPGDRIGDLVQPILHGEADMVVADRQTDQIEHFSPIKKLLQRWGSGVVRRLSDTDVADSPSGFRAIGRRAALRLFVHNRFTYTLETVIQAGRSGFAVKNVKIETNPDLRKSRLFKSIPAYLRRAGGVMLRAYAMYRPVQVFAGLAALLFVAGAASWLRFLYIYFISGDSAAGHVQSLVVGTGLLVLAFVLGVAAMLGELLAANRRLLEELLSRVRDLDSRDRTAHRGIASTGVSPWNESPPVSLDAIESEDHETASTNVSTT
ncbi:MAG: glycosyltransferase family 2 protein [Myxococcota bacterium]